MGVSLPSLIYMLYSHKELVEFIRLARIPLSLLPERIFKQNPHPKGQNSAMVAVAKGHP
jgi:hypothetical protein